MKNEISRHKIIFTWLLNCPYFEKLFFIFSPDENESAVIVPDEIITSYSDDNQIEQSYIDGSQLRYYTFNVISFQPYNALANFEAFENIDFVEIVQNIADWISVQFENKNLPNFGENCEILKIDIINLSDGISAVDENGAKYMFAVRFKYFDTTNKKI